MKVFDFSVPTRVLFRRRRGEAGQGDRPELGRKAMLLGCQGHDAAGRDPAAAVEGLLQERRSAGGGVRRRGAQPERRGHRQADPGVPREQVRFHRGPGRRELHGFRQGSSVPRRAGRRDDPRLSCRRPARDAGPHGARLPHRVRDNHGRHGIRDHAVVGHHEHETPREARHGQ